MKPRTLWSTLISVSLFLALFSGSMPTTSYIAEAQKVPDHYIVVLRDDVADPGAAAKDIAQKHGLALGFVYKYALKGFSATIPAAALDGVSRDPRVSFVEQDQIVHAFAQTLPTGVNRIDADLNPTAKIDGIDERVNVDIAIIDTGIQLNHPDLYVFKDVTFVSGTSTGNDDNGHGTHVAGTAAALDNGIGVVGVAPGARLWAVKVLDRTGSGTLSRVIAGIDYVTNNAKDIEVANMSLGCNCSSDAGDTAINNSVAAGVTYAVAAGNSASDASSFWPASNSKVITVSAIADSDGMCGALGPATNYGADDTFATFSNFGSVVDLAAPGVDILSTYKGSTYKTLSGTSMASPHVAGSAALYKANNPSASRAQVQSALINSAVPQNRSCDVSLKNGNGGFSGGLSLESLVYVGVSSPDFSISASPSALTIQAGASGSSTITVTSLNGFSGTVSLVASAPTGLSATLSSTSLAIASGGSGSSTLSMTVSSTTAPGTYTVTVTGTSGSLTHSATVTVTVPTVPSAPQNLKATAGNAQVMLSWSAPASDGGSAITNYKVYKGTISGGETFLIQLGNVLTYTDTSVTNEVTYYYYVTAVNSVGESVPSNEASAKPSASVPTLHVKSITTWTQTVGTSGNRKIDTQVTVVDVSNPSIGVQGATVSIIVTISGSGGTTTTLTGSGVTDALGNVTIIVGPTKEKGTYTSCVANVILTGWTFDAIKPCASGTL